jgi:hypothetical protein
MTESGSEEGLLVRAKPLVLQCYLYIGYEATASSPELEHFHYALPETFFAPLAVATVYRSPRPELLFR